MSDPTVPTSATPTDPTSTTTGPDPLTPASAATAATAATAPAKPVRNGFQFTEEGCRTDVRIGALLALIAMFLWLWFGPTRSSQIFLVGVPFLLWGIPWQAIQARTIGRPGFPWKLGLAMLVMGVAQWHDLRYREWPGGPVEAQVIGPMLTFCGAWILLWWPVARSGGSPATVAGAAS